MRPRGLKTLTKKKKQTKKKKKTTTKINAFKLSNHPSTGYKRYCSYKTMAVRIKHYRLSEYSDLRKGISRGLRENIFFLTGRGHRSGIL